MKKATSIVISVLLSILIIVTSVFTFASFNLKKAKQYNPIINLISTGAQLQGSTIRISYNPTLKQGEVTDKQVQDSIEIIRKRLNIEEFSTATVYQTGKGFTIEYPNTTNLSTAIDKFYRKGVVGVMVDSVDYFEYDANEYSVNPFIKGVKVQESYSQDGIIINTSGYSVTLEFTKAGREKFKEATAAAAATENSTITIVLDGDSSSPLSQATVSEEMDTPSVQISGNWTKEQAQIVASVIISGVLPAEFFNGTVVDGKEVKGETYSITCINGTKVNKLVKISFAISLLLILVLFVVFYRGFGVIADIMALISVLAFILIYAIIPGSIFTIPSVLGALTSALVFISILIVYFEKIKKEFKLGKTINSSISAGYSKAIMLALDVAIISLIVFFGGYFVCKWTVNAFFATFALGSLISATMLAISKLFVKLLKPLVKQDKFYNLKMVGGAEDEE